jgi:large subunit ribosomal protein L23
MIGKKKEAAAEAPVKAPKAKKEAAPKKAVEAKAPTAKNYATIIRPVVTEKATQISAHGQVVFQVALTASKGDIKDAVQNLFKVTVLAVNTTRRKGKIKAFRGRKAMRADTKLAYVQLEEGQNIDISAGI